MARRFPPRRLLAIAAVAMAITAVTVATAQPDWYVRARYRIDYETYLLAHARNYDLPPALLAAVIWEESGFDRDARSAAGAVGLMQLRPETARGIATRTGGNRFEDRDLLDPEINIRYGSWYLAHLHDKYAKRGDDDYTLTLAAYNAGQGKVDRWLAEDDDRQLELDEIPYEETRDYVADVQALRGRLARAYESL